MAKNKNQPTRRELNDVKLAVKIKNFAITATEFTKLSPEKQIEYLKLALQKKFSEDIKFSCKACAEKALFDESGYITDEDLLKDPKCAKFFKHA